MTIDLKKCPFCGGAAVIEDAYEICDRGFYNARCGCPFCKIMMTANYIMPHRGYAEPEDYDISKRIAVNMWNRRASDERTD